MATAVRNQIASPTRHEPLVDVQRLRSELSRFFDRWDDVPTLFDGAFTPLADVEETGDAYVVDIELPGIKKGDVDVTMEGRRLVVSGERKEKERTGVLRRRTRSVGRFRYEIVLPGNVDQDAVTANLDEGVLTIRVPKSTGERSRHIKLN
jgi:HSP20 family protein